MVSNKETLKKDGALVSCLLIVYWYYAFYITVFHIDLYISPGWCRIFLAGEAAQHIYGHFVESW